MPASLKTSDIPEPQLKNFGVLCVLYSDFLKNLYSVDYE